MNELVSIAIATYNGGHFLEQQLESIYNQTYRYFEVVVTDDQSDDETVQILKRYNEKYGLRYYINDTRLGVLKNFESAVLKCRGYYIALCDQDDIWCPEKIQTLINNIGTASLIYSDGYIIDENGIIQTNKNDRRKISNEKWIRPFGIDSTDANFTKYLLLNSFILGCSVMFSREILDKAVPFYETDFNHDWWLTICAQQMGGIKFVNQPLFKYRIHNTNFSMIEARNREGEWEKFKNFNSDLIKEKRKKKKEQLLYVVKLFNKTEDAPFINDMTIYCNAHTKTFLNIKNFWITYKYLDVFFPSVSNFRQRLRLFTSLFK